MAAKVIATFGSGCWLQFPGCTGRVESIDHVLPQRAHGPTILNNLRPACTHCNGARGARIFSGIGANFHAVIGPPTAGKTTLVHELAKPDDIVLDFDKLTHALLPSIEDEHNRPEYLTGALTALWATAYRKLCLLPQPADVWLVKCLPATSKQPDLLYEWIALNYDVHVVDPGRAVVMDRLKQAHRNKGAYTLAKRWYSLNINQSTVDELSRERRAVLASYGLAPAASSRAKIERPAW